MLSPISFGHNPSISLPRNRRMLFLAGLGIVGQPTRNNMEKIFPNAFIFLSPIVNTPSSPVELPTLLFSSPSGTRDCDKRATELTVSNVSLFFFFFFLLDLVDHGRRR